VPIDHRDIRHKLPNQSRLALVWDIYSQYRLDVVSTHANVLGPVEQYWKPGVSQLIARLKLLLDIPPDGVGGV
jgi:hypothetical protein